MFDIEFLSNSKSQPGEKLRDLSPEMKPAPRWLSVAKKIFCTGDPKIWIANFGVRRLVGSFKKTTGHRQPTRAQFAPPPARCFPAAPGSRAASRLCFARPCARAGMA